jgi:hypothetical protein
MTRVSLYKETTYARSCSLSMDEYADLSLGILNVDVREKDTQRHIRILTREDLKYLEGRVDRWGHAKVFKHNGYMVVRW